MLRRFVLGMRMPAASYGRLGLMPHGAAVLTAVDAATAGAAGRAAVVVVVSSMRESRACAAASSSSSNPSSSNGKPYGGDKGFAARREHRQERHQPPRNSSSASSPSSHTKDSGAASSPDRPAAGSFQARGDEALMGVAESVTNVLVDRVLAKCSVDLEDVTTTVVGTVVGATKSYVSRCSVVIDDVEGQDGGRGGAVGDDAGRQRTQAGGTGNDEDGGDGLGGTRTVTGVGSSEAGAKCKMVLRAAIAAMIFKVPPRDGTATKRETQQQQQPQPSSSSSAGGSPYTPDACADILFTLLCSASTSSLRPTEPVVFIAWRDIFRAVCKYNPAALDTMRLTLSPAMTVVAREWRCTMVCAGRVDSGYPGAKKIDGADVAADTTVISCTDRSPLRAVMAMTEMVHARFFVVDHSPLGEWRATRKSISQLHAPQPWPSLKELVAYEFGDNVGLERLVTSPYVPAPRVDPRPRIAAVIFLVRQSATGDGSAPQAATAKDDDGDGDDDDGASGSVKRLGRGGKRIAVLGAGVGWSKKIAGNRNAPYSALLWHFNDVMRSFLQHRSSIAVIAAPRKSVSLDAARIAASTAIGTRRLSSLDDDTIAQLASLIDDGMVGCDGAAVASTGGAKSSSQSASSAAAAPIVLDEVDDAPPASPYAGREYINNTPASKSLMSCLRAAVQADACERFGDDAEVTLSIKRGGGLITCSLVVTPSKTVVGVASHKCEIGAVVAAFEDAYAKSQAAAAAAEMTAATTTTTTTTTAQPQRAGGNEVAAAPSTLVVVDGAAPPPNCDRPCELLDAVSALVHHRFGMHLQTSATHAVASDSPTELLAPPSKAEIAAAERERYNRGRAKNLRVDDDDSEAEVRAAAELAAHAAQQVTTVTAFVTTASSGTRLVLGRGFAPSTPDHATDAALRNCLVAVMQAHFANARLAVIDPGFRLVRLPPARLLTRPNNAFTHVRAHLNALNGGSRWGVVVRAKAPWHKRDEVEMFSAHIVSAAALVTPAGATTAAAAAAAAAASPGVAAGSADAATQVAYACDSTKSIVGAIQGCMLAAFESAGGDLKRLHAAAVRERFAAIPRGVKCLLRLAQDITSIMVGLQLVVVVEALLVAQINKWVWCVKLYIDGRSRRVSSKVGHPVPELQLDDQLRAAFAAADSTASSSASAVALSTATNGASATTATADDDATPHHLVFTGCVARDLVKKQAVAKAAYRYIEANFPDYCPTLRRDWPMMARTLAASVRDEAAAIKGLVTVELETKKQSVAQRLAERSDTERKRQEEKRGGERRGASGGGSDSKDEAAAAAAIDTNIAIRRFRKGNPLQRTEQGVLEGSAFRGMGGGGGGTGAGAGLAAAGSLHSSPKQAASATGAVDATPLRELLRSLLRKRKMELRVHEQRIGSGFVVYLFGIPIIAGGGGRGGTAADDAGAGKPTLDLSGEVELCSEVEASAHKALAMACYRVLQERFPEQLMSAVADDEHLLDPVLGA